MKNLLLPIFLLLTLSTHAQSWLPVGTTDFSAGSISYPPVSIAIDTSGTPYVAHGDVAYGGAATVMKYDGSNWITVGSPGFSAGIAGNPSLAIDAGGTPYVAYADDANSYRATVMKYNGSSWVTVGAPGFSIGAAGYISIAIDTGGTPYVVYSDVGDTQKATVMKYNGSTWVSVGTEGFSDSVSDYVSIAIDANGTPYVFYKDDSHLSPGAGTVMKYNGSNWVTVGVPGFPAGDGVYNCSIKIGAGGTPYIAFEDYDYRYKATVMKYNGSSWVYVGNAGFSPGDAESLNMAMDESGTPYVAFGDFTDADKATVMKYVDSSWDIVGSAGFSEGGAWYTAIALDGNGTPYVAYADSINSFDPTVMRFGFPEAVKNITNSPATSIAMFPDPNQGSFTISFSSPVHENAQITITDMLGEVVKQFTLTSNIDTQIKLDAPPDIYMLRLSTSNATETRKFIIR